MDITNTKKQTLKDKLVQQLHNPFRLRVALCVVLMATWYWLGFAPMDDQITATSISLARDRKRLALATEVEALREKAAEYADRLPPRSDPNEFAQYILDGVRAGPLKLVSLNPESPKDAGLYEVAGVKIELEGKYKDVDTFFRWVENDKRLLRIDTITASPDAREPDLLRVQLSVLGLMGVEEKPKSETKGDSTKGDSTKGDSTKSGSTKGEPTKATPKKGAPTKATPKKVPPGGPPPTKPPTFQPEIIGAPGEKAGEKSVRSDP